MALISTMLQHASSPLSEKDIEKLVKDAQTVGEQRARRSAAWLMFRRMLLVNAIAFGSELFFNWIAGTALLSAGMVIWPITTVLLLPLLLATVMEVSDLSHRAGRLFSLAANIICADIKYKKGFDKKLTPDQLAIIGREMLPIMERISGHKMTLNGQTVDPEDIRCGKCNQRLATIEQCCPVCKEMPHVENTVPTGSGSVPDGNGQPNPGSGEVAHSATCASGCEGK